MYPLDTSKEQYDVLILVMWPASTQESDSLSSFNSYMTALVNENVAYKTPVNIKKQTEVIIEINKMVFSCKFVFKSLLF